MQYIRKAFDLEIDVFSEMIHASVSMRNRVRQLFAYMDAAGLDVSTYIGILEDEGLLPCRDKREGKAALDRLCGILQYSPEDISERTGRTKENDNTPFKLFIEEDLRDAPDVGSMAQRLRNPETAYIKHYKDIMAKGAVRGDVQSRGKSMVFARKTGRLLYEGAPVCQDFGSSHFYYTSCVMNCLYDCEYCYLKGMYPADIPVIFVNLDDIFKEVEKLLGSFPVYLCVSYDTDLMALEDLTGYVRRWCVFTKAHKDLTIEIRTKCSRTDLWKDIEWCDRVIFAYTLSPDDIIIKYEKGTPSLDQRIGAIVSGMDAYAGYTDADGTASYPFRLCFDPMIYVNGWQELYHDMWDRIRSCIDLGHIRDYSVGSFRISDSYLKNMRMRSADSALVQYPYDVVDGYYQYPEKIADEMECYMNRLITDAVPGAKVFRWK